MTPPLVTKVTQDATLDEFSVSDYRDMVQELLQRYSLRQLDDLTGNICSPALWAKVGHGQAPANRKQRNELRKLFDRDPLPPTVADAVSVVSPDAAVWAVGEGIPEHVIMVASAEPVTLHVNGSVTLAQECPVTPVTNGTARRSRTRAKFVRPCATATQESRRIATGASWAEIIEAGLHAMEMRR